MTSRLSKAVNFGVRFTLGVSLALAGGLAASWIAGQEFGVTGSGQPIPGPDFRNPDKIVRADMGPAGHLYIRRESGLEAHGPGGRAAYRRVSLDDHPGLEPFSALEMAGAPGGDLFVVGVLEESRDLAVYRVGLDGSVEAWAVIPDMAPSDIAVGPDGTVYLLALATPRLNRVLTRPESDEVISEPQIHELDASGRIARQFLVREFRLHDPDEAGDAIDAFHEQRLAVGRDGSLYLYSRIGGEVARVDPGSGESVGTAHLTWAGFPAEVRITSFQMVDERQLVYSLVELNSLGWVSGFQAWQIDLQGGARKMIHRTKGEAGFIWQAHFDPVHRRLLLLDILDEGRNSVREVEFQDLRDRVRIH